MILIKVNIIWKHVSALMRLQVTIFINEFHRLWMCWNRFDSCCPGASEWREAETMVFFPFIKGFSSLKMYVNAVQCGLVLFSFLFLYPAACRHLCRFPWLADYDLQLLYLFDLEAIGETVLSVMCCFLFIAFWGEVCGNPVLKKV